MIPPRPPPASLRDIDPIPRRFAAPSRSPPGRPGAGLIVPRRSRCDRSGGRLGGASGAGRNRDLWLSWLARLVRRRRPTRTTERLLPLVLLDLANLGYPRVGVRAGCHTGSRTPTCDNFARPTASVDGWMVVVDGVDAMDGGGMEAAQEQGAATMSVFTRSACVRACACARSRSPIDPVFPVSFAHPLTTASQVRPMARASTIYKRWDTGRSGGHTANG